MAVAAHYLSEPDEIWVGFRNNTGLAWLKFLKSGFRHCFLLLKFGDHWLIYDPLAHYTRFDLVPAEHELLDLFCENGCLLIPARRSQLRLSPMPWRPYSCVEAVKRALGLRAGWVLTPWQLYCYLADAWRANKSS
jgi:hypothetical protein